MMKSYDEIIAAARKIGPRRLAVAGQPNDELAQALNRAADESIASSVIFDDASRAVVSVACGVADVLM